MDNHPWQLTPAEWEVVKRVCAGCNTRRKIAASLRIADRTVAAHLFSIFRKLHIHNRPALILKMENDPVARELCFPRHAAVQETAPGVFMIKLTLYTMGLESAPVLVHPDALESVRPTRTRTESYTTIRTRGGDEIAVCESIAAIERLLIAFDSHRHTHIP